MKVNQLFVKDIGRDLKGVIKVGQDDNANIKQELEEYVVTRELQKHFRDFFDSYKKGITGNTDKMGVWISGFFGSGKSHFLKILSYLLENKTIDGKTAFEYFEADEKIKDRMVLADMKLASTVPTDVALFNIDSKSEMNGKENKEAILSVFLKVFNEMQGFYGAIPALADVERNLTETGRYEEFEEAFKDSFGTPWKEARSDFDFIQDDFVEVLVDMDYMSEAAARNICEKATRPYSITIEEFALMVKKYLDNKGNNHHIAFLVDEIGQYIGEDSNLMLNLQTVVENLGTTCQGKAWVVVTSQQDIDSITKTKGNDFSKIQGRFDTRLSLTSSNVDEVIRERILKKTDSANQTLKLYYDEKETIAKNLIMFNDGIDKKLYSDRINFSEVYPFIPYQFNLLGDVLTAIRTHGASGKHLAEGERSMLALFKESAARIRYEEVGTLVPFHMFYDALEQFLDHSHRGVISRALDNDYINPLREEDCFDVNVLKTLFMIKYVKEIKPTLENITSLMVSHMDNDRMELLQKVEDALKRLIKQTLVQKNNDNYVFLTDEEQEITIAIKQQQVEVGEVTAKVSELIFDGLFDTKKYRHPALNNRYAFAFNQMVDEKPYKANQNYDITLRVLTPNSEEDITDENTMIMVSGQSQCVLVVLPDDRAFLDEIHSALQIEKFIRYDATNAVTKYEQIKEAKKVELRERNANARLYLEESLKEAAIFVGGHKITINSKEVTSKINEALGKLVTTVYHKLSYIDTAMGEMDIRKLFNDNHQQIVMAGATKASNTLALDDVKAYIDTNTARHMKTSMKALLDRFMKAPYGFIEADIQWLVAKLFKDADISFYVNNESVTLLNKSVDDIVRYITRKEYNEKLMTERRTVTPEKYKKSVKEVMKELFKVSPNSEDEDSVMASFLNYADKLKNELAGFDVHYKMQSAYPGKNIVSQGKQLMADVTQLKNASEFFKAVYDNADDYLDFAEDIHSVKDFFASEQVTIFNDALKLMAIYDDSKTFIVDSVIENCVSKVKAILKMPKPYTSIKNLPPLLDEFMDAYNALLSKEEEPIKKEVEEARVRVLDEIKGKLCENDFKGKILNDFDELRNKVTHCNNVAVLLNIKVEANALKLRWLQDIAEKENELIEKKKIDLQMFAKGGSNEGGEPTTDPAPTPVIKKNKVIGIKTINTVTSWQIETAEDVKKYVAELERKLLEQLEENTVIHIEF